MAKSKPKSRRRIWRKLLIAVFGLGMFLLMFVAAFIFNPFESALPELRDVVPRDVNFFVRKQRLTEDFETFPVPAFWSNLANANGFSALENGSIGQSLKRGGLEGAIEGVARTFDQVRTDTGGFLDILRDVIGRELIIAGYEQDYTQSPPRPLAEPWWCVYTRVNWRVKAVHGLAGFGFVQSRMAEQGLTVTTQGDLLVVTPRGQAPIYVKRHLDVLMAANNTLLLDKTQRLIDGNRDEEPIGQMPAYTDGALARIDRWADVNSVDQPNVVEFVVEPNAFDDFSRFASRWPNRDNKDSMNERVLASFLKLQGWMQLTGGVIFDEGVLDVTGQIGLNSKQHSSFQSSFYTAEQQRREEWLDPFVQMVPESACAAAALRMPAGEFMHAMFDALEEDEKRLIDDALKQANYQDNRLSGVGDLIDRVRNAFLPRTGFVFRRNTPDLSKDDNGELMVPVAAKSPMPQVAWVFWLRPNARQLVEDLVKMLQLHYVNFGFRKVWHLKVPFAGGALPEPVTEFTNPQIPATGEIAMIVFRDFFVVSNSGPLIRDILRTRYPQTGSRSIKFHPKFEAGSRELASALNGMVWLNGEKLGTVLDDYLEFADTSSEIPDADWMRINRLAAEEQVRRSRYPTYPSPASMPPSFTEPGGEFEVAVTAHLREQWAKTRTNFTAGDRADILQMRGMCQLLEAALVQVELQNNYIRYQARLMMNFR